MDNVLDFTELSITGAPNIKITPPGPKSKEYLEYQTLHESSAVSYSKGMPMAIRRGKGATVEDVDGNIYIDLFGGAGVMAVGHSNPVVLEAARKQLEEFTHTLDIPHPCRKAMVEVLHKILPEELNRVFFGGPTGSDAVEQAIKLAKYNTKRFTFIAFEGGYHGMTAGALSLTSALSYREDFLPLTPEAHFSPYAYCYRCPFGKSQGKCDMECTRYLNHILEDPHTGIGKPAAIIVEPIQGEGGTVVPPDTFLPAVREICDQYGILMIADEIQCGLGRTGKMFAFDHTDTIPDMVTISKALGGLGFPISAIAYKEELNTLPPAKTIGTFRGNMIAYAAGTEALNFMIDNNVAEYALKQGENALYILKELEKDSRIVGEARGRGLMLGVEFVVDKSTKKPAPECAKKVRTLCHQRGVLIEIGGHYGNVARFLPPLIITEELLRTGLEIFSESVKDIEKTL